jgi:hypothetical protein
LRSEWFKVIRQKAKHFFTVQTDPLPDFSVFAPIVINRIRDRFDISHEEPLSAYDGWLERSGTHG